jgi:hypothetical protein
MKKSIILVAILAIVSVGSAIAQPRAIGANIGYGIDLSYQHSLGEANMIDVSINVPFFEGIGATATYDWVNPFGAVIPWDYEGQWNWNLGVGAGLGIYGFKAPAFYAGVVGHVGISYDFWFPMQLSLDYRPNIGIVGGEGLTFNTSGLYSGITLGVRYLF